jgi:hypothetical protein
VPPFIYYYAECRGVAKSAYAYPFFLAFLVLGHIVINQTLFSVKKLG